MSMQRIGIGEPHRVVTFPVVEDEDAAIGSRVRLLVTAPTRRGVESLARRIHAAGARGPLPFVHTLACDFPIGADALSGHCAAVLDAAAGGSMLINGVEDMPPIVQDVLLEVLDGLEFAQRPSARVRLIAGTTVSLLDRVTAGTFSDRLFYRLNVIHLVQEGPT
jgi:DNA-binding NtrC family response regulator